MTNLYIQTVMALSLVIGLIYLAGTFMKKRQDKDSLMKVMGFQSLGPKKGIAMVKVGQEILLVGVTATDIKLLKTFEDNLEEVESDPLPEKIGTSTFADISDKLKKLRALKDTVYAIK